RRAAVPLTLSATSIHPGGQPWWLPGEHDLTPVEPHAATVDDPETHLAVVGALETAGYREVELVELATTDGGTLVATVTASTTDGDPIDGPVWLHPTSDGFALLGAPST